MKKLTALLATVLLSVAFAFTAHAMNSKITFTDLSVNVGDEFGIKMKINSDANMSNGKVTISYDSSYLEFVSGEQTTGGAGTLVLNGDSSLGTTEWVYNLKFKALQPGASKIEVTDKEIYDASGNVAEVSHVGSSSITINGEEGSSINSNLSSLKISPGVLTPDFTPEVTEYTAIVGGSTEKIMVSAPAADSNAKVVISGNSDLKLGVNEIECKVTAPDGSTETVYKITVTKQEGEVDYGTTGGLLTANVNGIDYEVLESFDESLLPEGFTKTTYDYKGTTVQAGIGESNGMILMYLLGADGSGDLYLYDPANDAWSPYATISVSEKFITIVPLPEAVEVPEGFSQTTIELNGKKVRGWVWATDPEQKYCIVYGMNSDGEKDFYRYDMKEKTIQRYFSDPALENEGEMEEISALQTQIEDLELKLKTQKTIMMALGGVAALLLIILIIVLIVTRSKADDIDYTDRIADKSRRSAKSYTSASGERKIESGYSRRPEINDDEYDDEYDDGFDAVDLDNEPQKAAPSTAETLYEEPVYTAQTKTIEEKQFEEDLSASLAMDVSEVKALKEDDDFDTFEI